MNQVVLIGRLVKTPEVIETESGKKVSYITLAVQRSYKNVDGEYDADFIDCVLWETIAKNTSEYCKQGNVIGVKGRIQTRIIENDDGDNYKKMEVIAERITFLSSKKAEIEEQ